MSQLFAEFWGVLSSYMDTTRSRRGDFFWFGHSMATEEMDPGESGTYIVCTTPGDSKVVFASTVDTKNHGARENRCVSEASGESVTLVDRKLYHHGWFLCGVIELLHVNSMISVITDITNEREIS